LIHNFFFQETGTLTLFFFPSSPGQKEQVLPSYCALPRRHDYPSPFFVPHKKHFYKPFPGLTARGSSLLGFLFPRFFGSVSLVRILPLPAQEIHRVMSFFSPKRFRTQVHPLPKLFPLPLFCFWLTAFCPSFVVVEIPPSVYETWLLLPWRSIASIFPHSKCGCGFCLVFFPLWFPVL